MDKGCQNSEEPISGMAGVTLFTGPGEGYDPSINRSNTRKVMMQ
jgi:hypothetical protein